ncbi:MAG: hypothetical protein J7K02_00625 [Deltaproteobacteria bacterium]|nr:hypothetical protein [Deltaproteobacteria bacterium]
MKISYNYISSVAIGNFNPSILSVEFLKRVCKLDLGEPINESPRTIPVIKHLKFQELEFTVELNRLEIKDTIIGETLETEVLNIFEIYYQKLPYTPLMAVGININCDLIPKDNIEFQTVEKKISNPNSYLDFFESDQVLVNEKALFMKNDKTWIGSNYRLETGNDLTRQVDSSKKNEFFNINYNWEAGNLAENTLKRDALLGKLFGKYKDFSTEFLRFIKYLQG